ncbi:MAG: hypothetical protein ACJATV_000021 [Granulosicoccus sp.]|jgi:hypothetical protein
MHVLALIALPMTTLALTAKLFLALAVLLSGIMFLRRQQIQPIFRLYRDQDEWRLVAESVGHIYCVRNTDSSANINAESQISNHANVANLWCFAPKKIFSPINTLINACFPSLWKTGSTYKIVSWSYCSQFLLVIRIETGRNRLVYLPIMFDSCPPDEFRWIKVVIKYLL